MAKRRKKHTRRRSRRSVGAMGNVLTEVVGITVGAAAGRIVSGKLFPALNPTIKSAAVIGIGAFLMPKIIKGSFGSSIGAGMIASGSLGVLSGTGVLGAIDDAVGMADVGQFDDLSGIDDIGAFDDISGVDDMEIGAMEEDF